MLTNNEATNLFTPPEHIQTFRILQGLCPHNTGWVLIGHSHNEDAFRCLLCGQIEFY